MIENAILPPSTRRLSAAQPTLTRAELWISDQLRKSLLDRINGDQQPESKRVAWTQAAQAELEAISDYIKTDNPVRAASFVNEIVDAGKGISNMPRAFPLVPRLDQHGIRRGVIGRYLFFYRIEAESIQILHVVHGARDYIRSLFP